MEPTDLTCPKCGTTWKLIKAGDSPPEELKKLAKQACKANPDDCGLVEGQYKDAIYQFVTPVEDEAKKRWKDTLSRASQMGVTNEYVKKARGRLTGIERHRAGVDRRVRRRVSGALPVGAD